KPTCNKLKEVTEDALTTTLDEAPLTMEILPKPDSMNLEQIIKVLDSSNIIKDWMDSVHTYAFHQLEAGVAIPGYKLVKKKTNRKVKDESEVIAQFGETFGDDLYDRKLIGL